jgi:hypothetical protein
MHLEVGLAGGGRASLHEWLDVAELSLDALLHGAELQGDADTSVTAIHSLSALRASAAINRWREAWGTGAGTDSDASFSPLDVRIRTFPVGFSTRNFVLVGSPQAP